MSQNWVDEVVTLCEHVETPRSWLWWSLICAISAAAGNNYHLKTLKGAVTYKPNLYVILLGESGLGKGFPVNLSKTLVQRADTTRVIAGRSSIQAIVKELSLSRTRPDKEPILDSRGFIVNGELSTAIIQDPDSLTILTDLYDGHYNAEWSNLLKGDGAEKLKEPYITALFGSSPAHFYDSIPQVNIEGGYLGRNLIIFEEKRYKDSDLLDDDAGLDFPYDEYAKHLKYIGTKSGRIIPNFEAKTLFNIWRKGWREKQSTDKTGFLNRVPDHALKVAMCLALAEPELSNLIIREEHIEQAIEKVTTLTYANQKASEGRGTDPIAAVTKVVLDFLLTAPKNELTRRQLITKGYNHGSYDSFTLDKIIETLHEMQWIEKENLIAGKNSDIIVKLTGEPLEQYKKFIEKRKKK